MSENNRVQQQDVLAASKNVILTYYFSELCFKICFVYENCHTAFPPSNVVTDTQFVIMRIFITLPL